LIHVKQSAPSRRNESPRRPPLRAARA
jgi:hypothetical protein